MIVLRYNFITTVLTVILCHTISIHRNCDTLIYATTVLFKSYPLKLEALYIKNKIDMNDERQNIQGVLYN